MNQCAMDDSDSCVKTMAFGDDFIAESPALKDLLKVAKNVAHVSSPVLIMGEHGSGKSLFARRIFLCGEHSSRPFISVNCMSFGSGSLLSSVVEEASDGGLLLRNVEYLPIALQKELLGLLQGNAGVRVFATTSCNLSERVPKGEFSEELYFRFNALPVRIPPLRERREDILPMALFFLKRYSVEVGRHFAGFSSKAVSNMLLYRWPGNARELEFVVARACITGASNEIVNEDLRLAPSCKGCDDFDEMADVISSNEGGDRSLKIALEKFKRAYIVKILEGCNWNQTRASKILGIQRTYVSRLIFELHIRENK